MQNMFYINSSEEVINQYAGADKKRTVIIDNEKYLVKLPSLANHNYEASYTNNVFSEYIGCHIFNSIGIKAQETYIGEFKDDREVLKYACACKDFTTSNWHLIEFQKLKNSYNDDTENTSSGRSTKLASIEEVILNHKLIPNKEELHEFFWNMFIIDALIGNFDRHNGNWGILVNEEGNVKIAPVYDCGSALFAQLTDEQMAVILKKKNEMNDRVYNRPTSTLLINDKRINYYNFITSMANENCNKAILTIVPKINMLKINEIIDNTPYISDIRKTFYKEILKRRYEKILLFTYKKLTNK